MKITSTYKQNPKQKKKYPEIKIFEGDGTIVSFCDTNTGTILGIADTLKGEGYYIGSYRTDWIESGFIPFHGEIIIKSEP